MNVEFTKNHPSENAVHCQTPNTTNGKIDIPAVAGQPAEVADLQLL